MSCKKCNEQNICNDYKNVEKSSKKQTVITNLCMLLCAGSIVFLGVAGMIGFIGIFALSNSFFVVAKILIVIAIILCVSSFVLSILSLVNYSKERCAGNILSDNIKKRAIAGIVISAYLLLSSLIVTIMVILT